MHARTLVRLFTTAISASLASCGGTEGTSPQPTADGGTTSDGGVASLDGGALTNAFDCANPSVTYEAIRASIGADYLELRAAAQGTDGGQTYTVTVSAGTKCASATNKAKCESDLTALTATSYLFPNSGNALPGGRYIALTNADAVAAVTTEAEALVLVAPMKAPASAWLRAESAGYDVSCGGAWIRPEGDGFVVAATKRISDCPVQNRSYVLSIARGGVITVLAEKDEPETGACIGRRPAGLEMPPATRGSSTVGDWFARAAWLEAASVPAFRTLARELRAHGAPAHLIRRARRAARDEVRHARTVGALARRHGGRVERAVPCPPKTDVRSLFAIAMDNVVEGCVRETYGALEGMWQARAASDPHVRAAMGRLARDESRHGALAWQIQAWLEPRLSPAERAEVRAARAHAVGQLAVAARTPKDPALVRVAGVPEPARAAALFGALEASLWTSDTVSHAA